MAHIVAEPCIKCKYTDCVTVCPVDCFHEDAEMLSLTRKSVLTAALVSRNALFRPSMLILICLKNIKALQR